MRTPGVPGRSTPHHPRLAGLHALQEVVVLLFLAGLLRPVEVVVLGDLDLVVIKIARLEVLSCRVLQQDPGKQASQENVVKFRIMDENSVVEVRVKLEEVGSLVSVR